MAGPDRPDRDLFARPPNEFRFYAITHALEGHVSAQPDRLVTLMHPDRPTRRTASPTQLVRWLAGAGYGGIVTNVAFVDYLRDEESWAYLREGLATARELGMVAWLYDEKGYPSGSAGGLVLEGHPELQAAGLGYHYRDGTGPGELSLEVPSGELVYAVAVPLADGQPDPTRGHEVVAPDAPGRPLHHRIGGGSWRLMAFVFQPLFEGTHGTSNFSERRPCINILDPRATAQFVEVTHEAYAARLGEFFGTPVTAFFTDEPSLQTGWVCDEGMPFSAVPWTESIARDFEARYGYSLLPRLPALFDDAGPETGRIRAEFYALVAEQCAAAYFGTLQEWCRAHGVASTGHLLWEEFLLWHVAFEGSALAALRRFDIPGLDRLSSDPVLLDLDDATPVSHLAGPGAGELRAAMAGADLGSYADLLMARKGWTAAKLVSSAAHCNGTTQAMVELSAILEKWRHCPVELAQVQGTLNWLYALGINCISSYFDWDAFSVADNRAMNEHAGRLGLLATAGEHVADIAVLYPVTGVWPHYVPARSHVREMEQSPEARAANDACDEIARQLLIHQRDFDFLDDAALAEATIEAGSAGVALRLHGEWYRALVLPPMSMIRQSTLEKAGAFRRAGGIVIAVEPVPSSLLEDGRIDAGALLDPLFAPGTSGARRASSPGELAPALAESLPADLRLEPACNHILYLHRRTPEADSYLIANHGATPASVTCELRAWGRPSLWDSSTGTISTAAGYETTPRGSRLPLQLAPYTALFVVLER